MGRKAKVVLFSACAAGEQKEAAPRKGISGQDGVVVHECCKRLVLIVFLSEPGRLSLSEPVTLFLSA